MTALLNPLTSFCADTVAYPVVGNPAGKSASKVMQKNATSRRALALDSALFTSGFREATMICKGREPNLKTAARKRLVVRVPLPP